MIWTVILKDGKSFVVVGSSPSFNHEIRRSLVARSVEEKDVAAVVKGNHPVLEFPSTMPISRWGGTLTSDGLLWLLRRSVIVILKKSLAT